MGQLCLLEDDIEFNPDIDVYKQNKIGSLKYGFQEMGAEEAEKQFGFPFLCRIGIDVGKIKNGRLGNGMEIDEKINEHLIKALAYFWQRFYRGKEFDNQIMEEFNSHKIIEHSFLIIGKDIQGNYICAEQAGKGGPFLISSIEEICSHYIGSEIYCTNIK